MLQTVQKNNNNNNLHMDRQCKKNNKQFTYGQTVQKKQQTIYIWTDSAKKLHWSIYSAPDSAKKKKNTTTTTIYIWTVHIYRPYRRQCAKYTYIYSVHIVYYKDTLNYQRHIIHRMGTSTLCTVSIHNVVYKYIYIYIYIYIYYILNIYSGAKKYLVSHQLCKFSHLKR